MQTVQLGDFTLEFELEGKLAQIFASPLGPLLHERTYRLDLGGGRFFDPRGWDECFPTIEAFGGSGAMGDLIGVSPVCAMADDRFVQEWALPTYRATRSFHAISGCQLEMNFSVGNHGSNELRFVWASHLIFSVEALQRVVFADRSVLDEFSADGTTAKVFKPNEGSVNLVYAKGGLVLESDQAWWGIWNNRGGWPADRPAGLTCLAVEATNADADFPRDACIPSGGRFTGRVTLTINEKNNSNDN